MIEGLIIDNFAGGGGASTGIELGIGRAVNIAINHDEQAITMHQANHPRTLHLTEDVFKVNPVKVTKGQDVGLAWFSPDCKHFSKAKGGKPVSKKIRGLAWIVIRWARRVKPKIIMLENVEEFEDWGPLTDHDMPCKQRRGFYFERWLSELRKAGYKVEWRTLRACDYGAPTIRKRLFLIARRDGLPIVWPRATHGPGLIPYRTAAECIDWSVPCPSIFERKRPLAENTLKRIAVGIDRYVINAKKPFIVSKERLHVPHVQRQYGNSVGHDINKPNGTVTAGGGGKSALVQAFLAKHYTGVIGTDLKDPIGTVTSVDHHSLVSAFLTEHANGKGRNFDMLEPLRTQCAETKGGHFAMVQAFLINYYSNGSGKTGAAVNKPAPTIPTRDRIGLVTIEGVDYQIIDIGMRMLTPRELYRAQGFRDDYIIDPEFNGKPLTKTAQVRMCGNSVCPPVVEALVRANCEMDAKDIAA